MNRSGASTRRVGRRAVLAGGLATTAALAAPWPAGASGTGPALDGRDGPDALNWRRLPDVPANRSDWSAAIPTGASYWSQIGLAGPVAGAHGDHLLVGGGANFPEPALTATRGNTLGKVYWNELWVMRRTTDGHRWLPQTFTLPDAVGYAACVSVDDGVLVIGGEGFRGGPSGSAVQPVQKFADVYLLRYDARSSTLARTDLPDLPRPASYAVAGVIDDVVYVAEGGDFWSLDLGAPDDGWVALPRWPGEPRSVAVGAVQRGRFFLMSGRSQRPDGSWVFHTDAYAYAPRAATWSRIADLPWCVTAGVGHPRGESELLVIAGDADLTRWNEIEHQKALRDAAPPDSAEWRERDRAITFIYDHHTGFNQEILRYEVARDRWSVAGRFPGPPQVTTPAVGWGEDLVVVSGEVGPGIRTPRVWLGSDGGRPR